MSSSAKSIPPRARTYGSISRSSPFSRSYLATSPIAQQAIARDIEELSDDGGPIGDSSDEDDEYDIPTGRRAIASEHSMTSTYHRPSFLAYGGGGRPTVTLQQQHAERNFLTKKARREIRDQERSLLRDNHLAPPKHPQQPFPNRFTKLWKRVFGTRRQKKDGEAADVISETRALLANGGLETARGRLERENRIWEEAVASGLIKTTWQREAKTLGQYASPMVVTFVLQYSLTVASIFTVGHIGKIELGAVSLASMTANITGYAIYQGLATSLDTLCAQAYGSGNKRLVGLQLQRMLWFLWLITIPIGLVWFFAEPILLLIIPERRSAELAGLYLKILLIGAPGFAAFEAAKRFVQAQGLFSATTYVLMIAAPLNALMNYLFVWKFGMGFIGAPIAVVVTDNLLPLLLFLYVYFIDGRECWGGFTKKAFRNWGPMVKLALPGLVMVLAEYLAFELLTLGASYISTTHLAAQSVLSTITALTFQVPFSISIAVSTRVANLIGATLSDAAKTSGKVAVVGACIVGLFNVTLLSTLRNQIGQLFTSDQDVVDLVAKILPLCAAFQLFDSLSAVSNGLLRGLGRQEVGGYVNLFCYYVIAMPLSFGTAFHLGWGLYGLWSGVALALGLVAAIEGIFLYKTNWERAVKEAQLRNDNA